jgi:hypothetical protein
MKMSDLMGKIKMIGDKSGSPDQLPPSAGSDNTTGGRK